MSVDRAREIYRELQKLARADYRGTTGSLLVVYGVEGFLRRLAASEYATKLTLKGGMLMAASATRRMTKDADLSAVGVANDPEHVARIVADILTVELPDNDGLEFDAGTIRTEVMREHADYHGVRTRIQGRLATAKPTITLDFSFGEPHRSVVIDLPELLGGGSIRLASYPPELTLAEKIATMMSRRELNTRDRDFADVWTLSRTLTLRRRCCVARSTMSPRIAATSLSRCTRPWQRCPTVKRPTRRCSRAWPTRARYRPRGASCSTASVTSSTH